MVVMGVSPLRVSAQSSVVGPLVLESTSSAQAAALGGAFPLGSGTADVLFYHPGALGRAQGLSAYRTSYGGAGGMSSVAAATSWFGGTVGVGLQSLNYRGSGGLAGGAQTESAIRTQPTAGTTPQTLAESVLSLGFAREVGPVEVGLVGKWVQMRAGAEQDAGVSVDVGTSVDAGPALIALAVRNIGSELSAPSGSLDPPVAVSLTAASDVMQLRGLDLSAAARLDRTGGGDFVPGAGLEVAWWPIQGRTFAARVGYGHPVEDDPASGITAGGSFRGDQIGLHYAFGKLNDDDVVHRFSLTWR